ncbi:MAG: alpha-galactosidase [Alphaproteobacteria bacterium]|nr:alpha-galactosidase [Alphaproteobacteria bacterium]
MDDRWLYLRGGEVSLLIDAHPEDGTLPRVLHFGADLGAAPDFDAIAALKPTIVWGARMDIPRPPCVIPGAEAGYFGTPAIVPSHAARWTLDRVEAVAEGFDLFFDVATGEPRNAFVRLEYRLSPHGVLASRACVYPSPDGFPDGLNWLAALALPLPATAHEVLSFGGDWAREFATQRQTLATGALVFESRRGRPGHDRFPGLFVGAPGFDEDRGDVYAFSLAWSGSHRLAVERLREGEIVVQAGELHLDADRTPDRYESPWCYATFSPRGLNGAMQALHAFVRERIVPRTVAAKPRPVHYNTWEAVYFKHDVATLKDLATRAAAVGAERFVLDDGWFKGRDDDRAALGDWIVDTRKYPDGLKPLIDHVRGLGLEFGLWVEPEMVNPDSDLARAHSDWLRRETGGPPLLQRHQAILDIARADVSAYLFDALNALLTAHPISYLKWDMNRDVTGAAHGAYVRALYALIDRLRTAHPAVEIETCASGGGRCDYGMLARTERVWVSDSNDALDRFEIQRNANLFLPPEIAGVHVGPAACHITGRRLSLDLRAHVALFGHMGLELDLRELNEADGKRLRQHVANHKRFRKLLHAGRYWRISFDDPDHAGICVSSDAEALVLIVRTGSAALGRGAVLRVPGLNDERAYRALAVAPVAASVAHGLSATLAKGGAALSGRVLAARGLELFLPRPETSLLLHFGAA